MADKSRESSSTIIHSHLLYNIVSILSFSTSTIACDHYARECSFGILKKKTKQNQKCPKKAPRKNRTAIHWRMRTTLEFKFRPTHVPIRPTDCICEPSLRVQFDNFTKNSKPTFSKISFRNTIRVSNIVDPDHVKFFLHKNLIISLFWYCLRPREHFCQGPNWLKG